MQFARLGYAAGISMVLLKEFRYEPSERRVIDASTNEVG
jgi:hypothetical protein